MKVTTYETLYHENHGATLKHKCGKKEIVALSLLSFSLILFIFLFFFSFFLWPPFFSFGLSLFSLSFFSFCKVRSLISTCGGIIAFIILSWLGQCSNNEDHHTFYGFTTQELELKARTRYDSIWMPPAVYQDMQWIKSDMYENYDGGLATNTMSTTWSCKEQYDNDETCHNKQNGGKWHGNISRNGYGNAIIGRYGGCFEEGK